MVHILLEVGWLVLRLRVASNLKLFPGLNLKYWDLQVCPMTPS